MGAITQIRVLGGTVGLAIRWVLLHPYQYHDDGNDISF